MQKVSLFFVGGGGGGGGVYLDGLTMRVRLKLTIKIMTTCEALDSLVINIAIQ